MTEKIKKEDQVLLVVCERFKTPIAKYWLSNYTKGRFLLIRKWTAFFIHKYTRRSFQDIGLIIKADKRKCMEHIAEIGFKIRTEPQYQIDFDAMVSVISKIYNNESN